MVWIELPTDTDKMLIFSQVVMISKMCIDPPLPNFRIVLEGKIQVSFNAEHMLGTKDDRMIVRYYTQLNITLTKKIDIFGSEQA